jgi:hypothetical protein
MVAIIYQKGEGTMNFSELTKAELGAFELLAIGQASHASPRTLKSLEKRGYLDSESQYLSGYPPVAVCKYSVPISVHIAWCQWCEKRLKGEDK